jgi:hypothetical protein
MFGKNPADTPSSWEPPAADARLAATSPKPTFTLGLDN